MRLTHRLAFCVVDHLTPRKLIHCILAANETLDIEYRSDRKSWDAFVTKINDALNPLDLEFAHLHDEVNGTEIYAVVWSSCTGRTRYVS